MRKLYPVFEGHTIRSTASGDRPTHIGKQAVRVPFQLQRICAEAGLRETGAPFTLAEIDAKLRDLDWPIEKRMRLKAVLAEAGLLRL
jgi:hypothetical protein